jgi:hypothetical protein
LGNLLEVPSFSPYSARGHTPKILKINDSIENSSHILEEALGHSSSSIIELRAFD